MLSEAHVLELPGITVAEVHCTGECRTWSSEEQVHTLAVVLVRRGFYKRRVNGVVQIADPVTGYIQRPGTIQQVAHPAGGDLCTVLVPSSEAIGSLIELAEANPALHATGRFELAHRTLVALARAGGEEFELGERAIALAGDLFESVGPSQSTNNIRSRRARRAVELTREALHHDIRQTLPELALSSGMSPYHLSRTFRNITGLTITAYRARLRLRRALELLGHRDAELAGVAADAGFADQAHLTRSLRAETGLTPRDARGLLAVPEGRRRI